MLKKAFFLTLLCISLSLFISCDDFLQNELNLRSSSGRGGKGSTTYNITVRANAVGKIYNAYTPAPDPPLTYKYSPDPLPDGVSITGELIRDTGEQAGTYVIRQGTLKLTGTNAGKYSLKFVGNVFSIYGY